jgi:hypothetical protein
LSRRRYAEYGAKKHRIWGRKAHDLGPKTRNCVWMIWSPKIWDHTSRCHVRPSGRLPSTEPIQQGGEMPFQSKLRVSICR